MPECSERSSLSSNTQAGALDLFERSAPFSAYRGNQRKKRSPRKHHPKTMPNSCNPTKSSQKSFRPTSRTPVRRKYRNQPSPSRRLRSSSEFTMCPMEPSYHVRQDVHKNGQNERSRKAYNWSIADAVTQGFVLGQAIAAATFRSSAFDRRSAQCTL